jgi:hypothetical protein
MEDDDTHRPMNHWVIFCLLSPFEAIKIDMRRNNAPPVLDQAKVFLSHCNYTVPFNLMKMVSLTVKPGTTAQDIIDLITATGKDRYKVAANGEGCRYWTWTVVWVLENAGVVAEGSMWRLWPAISHYWSSPERCERRSMTAGSFNF